MSYILQKSFYWIKFNIDKSCVNKACSINLGKKLNKLFLYSQKRHLWNLFAHKYFNEVLNTLFNHILYCILHGDLFIVYFPIYCLL